MNRIEFMTELASLLQDIPAEERRDAMQYYNDYFDDAGEDQEQQVIDELESPQKVAEKIKADMTGEAERQSGQQASGSFEGTYQQTKETHPGQQAGGQTFFSGSGRTWKIILIVVIGLCALPVILPAVLGILGAALGVVLAVFGFFLGLVLAAACILIAGIALIIAGIWCIVPELAIGLALIGSGLIVSVLGVLALVGSIKLCAMVFPAIWKGIVWICRKPFERKAVNRS